LARPSGCQNAAATRPPRPAGTLLRFGLLALLPVVALGVLLARELNADVQQRYLDSARTTGTVITQVGVQPLLTPQEVVYGMAPDQVAALDDGLQGAAVSEEVRRIKVWNATGTIIYSDNHALIGRKFEIDDDLGDALKGTASASITDGHDAENQGDDLQGPLVEVYAPLLFQGMTTPSGAFEVYLPYAPVQAAIDNESRQLYILLALGLTGFYAAIFLVFYIADRWRRRLLDEAEATAQANLAVLERLNNLKSEFLARISHEFRTALVGIEGFSELIRDSEVLDMSEARSFATDIHADAERLDRAFTNLLDLDRMEAGRSTLAVAPADVNAIVADAVGLARAESRSAKIVTDLAASLPRVMCDAARVEQVVGVLLRNAIKYSPAGSEVGVTTKASPEAVTVAVMDHGPGMPADFGDGLYGGYHTNGGGGTGLGLPIARQIVAMHGGRIWFDSRRGEGTEFYFTLPLQPIGRRVLQAVTAAR
jgi:signal transduction histidine kinase